MLVSVHNSLNSTFGKLDEAKLMDVEIAVRALYMLGEAICRQGFFKTQQLYSDASKFADLQQMMSLLQVVFPITDILLLLRCSLKLLSDMIDSF